MARSKVICISTWGDPSQWRYASYKFGEEKVSAFSTLNILEKLKNPDLMLIVASDTLAAKEGIQLSSYEDVVKATKAYVEKYLCDTKAEVIVLPGVMRISKQESEYVFKADLTDYRTLFLYEVYKRVINLGSTEELEIVLDISHGVNYMPTLALDAIQEVAAMASVSIAGTVKLEVYQADPYPILHPNEANKLSRNSKDPCKPSESVNPPELSYNCIRNLKTEPWDLVRYMNYLESGREKVLTDQRGLDVNPTELIQQSLTILGAFRLGALIQLAAVTRKSRVDDIKNVLEKAVLLWKNKRNIRREGKMLIVEGTTKFYESFRILLHASSIIIGVNKLIGEGGESVRLSELKKLKKLLENSRVTRTLVDRELSKLDNVKGRLSGEWKLYSEYLGQKEFDYEKKEDYGIIKRDFIAHAGFYSDMLEVRLSNNEPEIRVRNDCWNTIKKILGETAIRA